MKCTGLPHCHLVVMSKHSLLTCCPVPVTLTILPLQLTWSGLGQLESLTKLRSLNCSGIKHTEDGGDDAPLQKLLGQLHSLTMGDACTLSWVDDNLMSIVGTHATSLKDLDCSGCIDMSDAGALALG